MSVSGGNRKGAGPKRWCVVPQLQRTASLRPSSSEACVHTNKYVCERI